MEAADSFSTSLWARMLGAFVLLAAVSADPSAVVAQAASSANATAIYTAMVRSMAREPLPPTITYREPVVPHGLTLVIGKRGGSPVPTLVFSSSVTQEEFEIRQTPGATEVLDVTNGLRYTGSKIFWAASWSDARVANARTGDATAPRAAATPSSEAGSTAAVDRVRDNVIGEVSAISDRYYRIEDAGASSIDGNAVEHLHLIARTVPTNHPLTDLYVDATTSLLRRAVAAFKNEAFVSGYSGTMTLDFGRVDDYWMVVGGRVQSSAHVLLGRMSGSADFTIHDVETHA